MVMAEIYTHCGQYEEAIDELESVLSLETNITTHNLKFHVWTKPLQEIPRYKELLKQYALPTGT